ncbi:MAG: hypothetical protein AAFY30_14475 [Cyanobacteria bacterium J06642_12]
MGGVDIGSSSGECQGSSLGEHVETAVNGQEQESIIARHLRQQVATPGGNYLSSYSRTNFARL